MWNEHAYLGRYAERLLQGSFETQDTCLARYLLSQHLEQIINKIGI